MFNMQCGRGVIIIQLTLIYCELDNLILAMLHRFHKDWCLKFVLFPSVTSVGPSSYNTAMREW